jgi:hypothetical protein
MGISNVIDALSEAMVEEAGEEVSMMISYSVERSPPRGFARQAWFA